MQHNTVYILIVFTYEKIRVINNIVIAYTPTAVSQLREMPGNVAGSVLWNSNGCTDTSEKNWYNGICNTISMASCSSSAFITHHIILRCIDTLYESIRPSENSLLMNSRCAGTVLSISSVNTGRSNWNKYAAIIMKVKR